MTGGEQFNRSQREAPEVAPVELDRMQQVLAEMNVPALEQAQDFAAGPLADLHQTLGYRLA